MDYGVGDISDETPVWSLSDPTLQQQVYDKATGTFKLHFQVWRLFDNDRNFKLKLDKPYNWYTGYKHARSF